jgi:DtxR family transcriptional regulator, Mn-dependent transcriptional regulator
MADQDKAAAPRLTQAMENYLLSIYVVQERGVKVSNSNLVDQLRRVPASENLGTSLPAVSGMLRRMEKESLIRLGETRDIDLTNRGRGLAESIIRKHRLAARMVVDLLGVPLQEVDAEAHMLEHALSSTLEKRIQDRLGNPKTDPFGQPIPGSGYREPRGVVTLDNAPTGTPMIVDRIPEDDAELIAYLSESGVLPGVEVVVSDVAPYRGVVTLKVGDESAVLGYGVSSEIRLRPA